MTFSKRTLILAAISVLVMAVLIPIASSSIGFNKRAQYASDHRALVRLHEDLDLLLTSKVGRAIHFPNDYYKEFGRPSLDRRFELHEFPDLAKVPTNAVLCYSKLNYSGKRLALFGNGRVELMNIDKN
jgi:hypothetical protein